MRSDLPLGPALAQTIHAAGESARQAPALPDNTHAVALIAKDEAELLDLEQRLVARAVPHRAIREPDAPYCNQLVAIGIAPCARERVRPLVKRFPLAGQERRDGR